MKAKIVALFASGLFGARIWVISNKWDHKTCLDVRGLTQSQVAAHAELPDDGVV
jgi:hypothetical protein